MYFPRSFSARSLRKSTFSQLPNLGSRWNPSKSNIWKFPSSPSIKTCLLEYSFTKYHFQLWVWYRCDHLPVCEFRKVVRWGIVSVVSPRSAGLLSSSSSASTSNRLSSSWPPTVALPSGAYRRLVSSFPIPPVRSPCCWTWASLERRHYSDICFIPGPSPFCHLTFPLLGFKADSAEFSLYNKSKFSRSKANVIEVFQHYSC